MADRGGPFLPAHAERTGSRLGNFLSAAVQPPPAPVLLPAARPLPREFAAGEFVCREGPGEGRRMQEFARLGYSGAACLLRPAGRDIRARFSTLRRQSQS